MNRRFFLVTAGAALGTISLPLRAQRPTALPVRTRWVIRTSEGFDAIGFLSPLSGDPFYARYYEKELAVFRPRLAPQILSDIASLKNDIGQAGDLLSPHFYLYFSGGPDATLEDLFSSIEQPDRMRRAVEASPYWDADGWRDFVALLPRLKPLLVALRDAGFRQFRNAIVAPEASAKLPALRAKLANYDVLRWAAFYTGRSFDPTIEVIFMHFNKPHGIKIIGQRYLTGLAYSDDITIQTAAHEMLHPPLPMDGATAKAALAVLGKDPMLQGILAERDKSYGYGSVQGLFDEGLTKTVDQLIGEHLGTAQDPRKRWRTQDGGMHVLAAAFYGLMQHDGFARTGGNLEQWVARKVANGDFAPGPLHRAAGRVLGYAPDTLWPPPKA